VEFKGAESEREIELQAAKTVVLFDIDGTLLVTRGHGLAAMLAVGKALFGEGFRSDGVEFAGRLDPLIVGDLFDLSGVPRTAENFSRLRSGYGAELVRRLNVHPPLALEGGAALVNAVSAHPDAIAGVMTGNYVECGTAKLSAIGIDPTVFQIGVWGDESPHDPPHRDHLPGVALSRAAEAGFGTVRGVVIGDTPMDVRCAHAHGMRAMGVATGKFNVDDLSGAGADLVVQNLAETQSLLDWIVGAPGYHSAARTAGSRERT